MRMRNTDYALLGMLSIEPMSGYRINREIQESIAYFWKESFGQIYPALKRLATQGLIDAHSAADPRARTRVYSLTSKGKAHLREWLAQSPESQPPRNQLLLKLFFGRSTDPQVCLAHLKRFRRQLEDSLDLFSRLQSLVASERAGDPNMPFWLMTISHGKYQAEAQMKWCDESVELIARHRKKQGKASQSPRHKSSVGKASRG